MTLLWPTFDLSRFCTFPSWECGDSLVLLLGKVISQKFALCCQNLATKLESKPNQAPNWSRNTFRKTDTPFCLVRGKNPMFVLLDSMPRGSSLVSVNCLKTRLRWKYYLSYGYYTKYIYLWVISMETFIKVSSMVKIDNWNWVNYFPFQGDHY